MVLEAWKTQPNWVYSKYTKDITEKYNLRLIE